jgi:hypothetical protein
MHDLRGGVRSVADPGPGAVRTFLSVPEYFPPNPDATRETQKLIKQSFFQPFWYLNTGTIQL